MREGGRSAEIETPNKRTRDAELIRRFKGGDQGAFSSLIEEYQPSAIGYARKRVRNDADAEDIVADVFSRMASALEHFDGERSGFATWFYRVLDNAIIDFTRKARVRPTPAPRVSPDSFAANPSEDSSEPERRLAAKRLGESIVRAVSLLLEKLRQIWIMAEIDGRTMDEIAKALDMNVGTVRTNLRRARLQLREELASEGKEHGHGEPTADV